MEEEDGAEECKTREKRKKKDNENHKYDMHVQYKVGVAARVEPKITGRKSKRTCKNKKKKTDFFFKK